MRSCSRPRCARARSGDHPRIHPWLAAVQPQLPVAGILHSVGRAVFLRVAGALLVSHRHHVDVGIVGALRWCARADLHDHGIATAAVDQAMTVRHACLPGGRVAGPEHGFDAILAQDHFTFEYVNQLVLLLVPVALRGCGPGLERADVDTELSEAGCPTEPLARTPLDRLAERRR